MSASLTLRNCQRKKPVRPRSLARLTRFLLHDLLSQRDYLLAIHLVDRAEITRLNETFLKHAGSTDVITFDYADPAAPGFLSGDVFVCVDEAVAQARPFGVSWQSELVRYVVHGILHLRGYDDHTPAARRRMKREEDRLVSELARHFPFSALSLPRSRRLL